MTPSGKFISADVGKMREMVAAINEFVRDKYTLMDVGSLVSSLIFVATDLQAMLAGVQEEAWVNRTSRDVTLYLGESARKATLSQTESN